MMAYDSYLIDEFGNKYRNPNSFGKTTGQEYAAPIKNTQQPKGLAPSAVTPTTGLTMNNNYGLLNKYKDQFYNMFSNSGGLGSAGTYEYAPSISSETGELIPGGSIDVNENAAYAINNPDSTVGLGLDSLSAGDIASGIGAAANLANAYVGYKNYGLAKDKFGFEKAATNRNIENQAQQYNAELQNRAEIGLALGGSAITPEQRAATLAQMERQKISGAPIG